MPTPKIVHQTSAPVTASAETARRTVLRADKAKAMADGAGPVVLRAVLYGLPKAGKTTLAASAPKPLLMLSCEGGTDSVRGWPDVYVYELAHGAEGMLEFNEWLRILGEDNGRGALRLFNVDKPPATVVVDTISSLYANIVMPYCLSLPRSADEDPDLAGVRDYGRASEITIRFTNYLRSLPFHLIYTAELAEHKDPRGNVVYTTGLAGKLDLKIPYALDWAMHVRMVEMPVEGGGTKPAVAVDLRGTVGVVAGGRVPVDLVKQLPSQLVFDNPRQVGLANFIERLESLYASLRSKEAQPQ